QPLLYQVATGGLSPANIATPLRWLVRRQRNVRVLLDEARDFDLERRTVRLSNSELAFDRLVIATGMRNNYHGHPEWEHAAPGLKTLEDAVAMRSRILRAFEDAEREPDAERVRALLTFVVVGGGPTGVELAGALGEISRHTLRREFRAIDPSHARILLVDGGARILPGIPPDLSAKAARALRRLGVHVRLGTRVAELDDKGVVLVHAGGRERVAAATVLWAAGVRATPIGALLGAELDALGRVLVSPDLSLPDHPEVFVVGDLACVEDESGAPLPGIAPVAMQQGRYVANRIRNRTKKVFQYRPRGQMAVIGRAAGVADLGWTRVSGFPAWLTWLLVHLVFLVQFQNKLLVLLQWAWNYLTFGRAARIITREEEWQGPDHRG
ncbi:MAG: NAD(P)/FAD-dependent oxidoreductase, partial [Planctomycetota bacterium]|nr:NAD(P)/FAD-dependent oxidoreductase [Planctomycetota bacterium]